jgi:hypothetical protein
MDIVLPGGSCQTGRREQQDFAKISRIPARTAPRIVQKLKREDF